MFGRVQIDDDNDNEHTNGSMQYTPVYPCYVWEPQLPPDAQQQG